MAEKYLPGHILTREDKSRMCLYERMGYYQDQEKDIAFDPKDSVLIVRVLFRNLKRFSKVMTRPFDPDAFKLMEQTAGHLLNNFKGKFAHVTSDEITMVLQGTESNPLEYAGKKQKIVSSIASSAAAFYTIKLATLKDVDELYDRGVHPGFEVTVFKVPSKAETGNVLLWLEREATETCVRLICTSLGLGKFIDSKSLLERISILENVHKYNWATVDTLFKHGLYIKRKRVHYESEEYPRYILSNDITPFINTSINERNKRIFG